jgi:anti-sigma B factor antagonist
MNFTLKEYGDVVVVEIEGNILQENVDVLKGRFYDLIDNGKTHMVLNMAKSNYVSSLCLAVIVDVKNRLSLLEGDLKISNVNRLIHNLLEITNLVKKIEIYETTEEAVASFQKA